MVSEENIVGLSVSVSIDDQFVWSEGFGHSDLSRETPIIPGETYFRIASISKPITATILGRLWEDGMLDIDESLYTYVPDFPRKAYDFSLRQLATHRAGIRHYKKSEKESKELLSIEQGLSIFNKSKLLFEPGSQYNYSSYGYNLLGHAMERATNMSFEELLSTYISQPLGMDHTIADKGSYEDLNSSGFFTSNGKGKIKEAQAVNMYLKLPSGGMLSTSEDLVRLGNAYIFGRILDEETQVQMLENLPLPSGKKVGYGMGWGISKDKEGRTFISHTGGNTGSVCRLIVYPEQKLSIAVVSNTFGIDYLKFIRKLSEISQVFLSEIPSEG